MSVLRAVLVGETLQAGRLGHVVESTAERRRRAWELFVRYRDRRVGRVVEEACVDWTKGFAYSAPYEDLKVRPGR